MIDFHIDERQDQSHILYFKLPFSDPKVEWCVPEVELHYETNAYFIRQVTTEHRDGMAMVSVEADAMWYRLGDRTRVGTFENVDTTVSDGASAIIEGTGWTVGAATTTSTDTFSMDMDDASILKLLRQWAKVTGTDIVWDTIARTVSFVENRGNDLGVQFRYGRNIVGVLKRESAPAVTRLYGYGADGLTIAGINAGKEYVEDLSWYTDRGVDLDAVRPDGQTNREYYTKSASLYDERFLVDTSLLAYLEERIEELATGEVSYEASVIDLALNPSATELEYVRVNDRTRVVDQEVGFNVLTTVVRMDRYPLEPNRNVVELSSLPSSLSPSVTSRAGRPSSAEQWILYTDESDPVQMRNDATWTICRIPLRFRESGEMLMGADIRFIGVGTGTMHVQVIDASTDTEMYPSAWMETPYTDGEQVHLSIPMTTAHTGLSGSGDYRIRMQAMTTGGPDAASGANIEEESVQFWVLARRAVREVPTQPNVVRFNYVSDAAQQWTVPDGVFEVTITLAGAKGRDNQSGASEQGGNGGRVTFKRPVTPGQVYDIYAPRTGGNPTPGWPGGGDGGYAHAAPLRHAGGGGGYAAIIPAGGTLADAIGVAAGGGGGGDGYNLVGGIGGFLVGGTPPEANAGKGATQYAGGAGGSAGGGAGSFGEGGDGGDTGALGSPGGGGGGGWYGGGGGYGGGSDGWPGGGGSGYLKPDGLSYDLFVEDGAQAGNGYVEISWPEAD